MLPQELFVPKRLQYLFWRIKGHWFGLFNLINQPTSLWLFSGIQCAKFKINLFSYSAKEHWKKQPPFINLQGDSHPHCGQVLRSCLNQVRVAIVQISRGTTTEWKLLGLIRRHCLINGACSMLTLPDHIGKQTFN